MTNIGMTAYLCKVKRILRFVSFPFFSITQPVTKNLENPLTLVVETLVKALCPSSSN